MLSFDGTDDNVTITSVAALEITTALTVAVWARYDDPGTATSDRFYPVQKYDHTSGNQAGWLIQGRPDDSRTMFILRYDVDEYNYEAADDVNVADGSWHHIIWIFEDDGTIQRCFLDGVEDTTLTNMATGSGGDALNGIRDKSTNIMLGGISPFSLPDHGACSVQEARYYNRVLSDEECAFLGKCYLGQGCPISNGLIGYWPCDDIAPGANLASATIKDRSTGGNDGTGNDADTSGGQGGGTFLSRP